MTPRVRLLAPWQTAAGEHWPAGTVAPVMSPTRLRGLERRGWEAISKRRPIVVVELGGRARFIDKTDVERA